MRARSNPWPSLVDLFSTLLIAGLGGMALMASQMKDSKALQGKLDQSNAALASATDENRRLKEEIGRSGQELEGCQAELGKYQGLDHPPCWGVRDYLFDIELWDDGVTIQNRIQPALRRRARAWGLLGWPFGRKISEAQFKQLTSPLHRTYRSHDNCRILVRLIDRTSPSSKSAFKRGLAVVQGPFYVKVAGE